jgi:RNA 3'-terminal phosphate cyclase-like protein
MRKLNKINLEEKGYIHRIRGVCAGSKISSSILNNIVSKCRNVFNDYIPDVWIHTDFDKGEKASNSPGYSLSLQA